MTGDWVAGRDLCGLPSASSGSLVDPFPPHGESRPSRLPCAAHGRGCCGQCEVGLL